MPVIGSGDGKPGGCFRIRYGTSIVKAVQVNRVEGQGRMRGNLFVYAVNRPYLDALGLVTSCRREPQAVPAGGGLRLLPRSMADPPA